MVVTADTPTPYAPPAAILALIKRYRERGLPTPVNADVLGKAGISDSLIPRTLQALQTLDLIDEAGAPTDTFEGIRKAPEAEYQDRLAEWLKYTYAEVLSYVDPSIDDETQVRDAFRNYKPVGQQPRMVTLFLGLCSVAGLAPERLLQPQRGRAATPRVSQKAAPKAKRAAHKPAAGVPASDVPPALAGLLSSLPETGKGWTQDQRDKFLDTFGTVLDFCFPITEDEAPKQDNDNEEEENI